MNSFTAAHLRRGAVSLRPFALNQHSTGAASLRPYAQTLLRSCGGRRPACRWFGRPRPNAGAAQQAAVCGTQQAAGTPPAPARGTRASTQRAHFSNTTTPPHNSSSIFHLSSFLFSLCFGFRVSDFGFLPRVLAAVLLLALAQVSASAFDKIIVPEKAHPATLAAARIIAQKLALPESAIQVVAQPVAAPGCVLLKIVPEQPGLKHDGYTAAFANGGATICGARPRSLLFAAGDVHLWRERSTGTLTRDPAFATRTAAFHTRHSIAEFVAALGCNIVLGGSSGTVTFEKTLPEVFQQLDAATQAKLRKQQASDAARQAALVQECRDADVDYYPLLYGNDMARWSSGLLAAALKVFPSAQGTPATQSWERAALCPSDPATWKIIEAYVREFAQQSPGGGLYATFWDHYGIFCQCVRCQKNGLNQFPNELAECVRHYHAALAPLGKQLVVRTWSSGVPHWLGEQWVHAPGYDHFGGAATDLWARVIRELPPEIVIQTKVYHADCQPDARFSPLLGKAKPHPEIAEWQITGQTTGRFYFPAATVNHTAQTMRKSLELVGAAGGVSLYLGGTKQARYDLLDDIANSINVYAWRELAWQPDADVDKIWMDWATPIFGAQAARHIVNALKLSEPAVNRLFSALGLGSDTNSGFPNSIARRETLLKYTNRYFLPEGAQALAPTLENVQRVIAEKDDCLKQIDEMFRELELAKPHLKKEQAAELATRFDWLRECAICAKALDESLWRYRYLRARAELLTTDPEQLKFLAQSFDIVQAHRRTLFRFDPKQKFSCYDVTLGELPGKPSLGSPVTMMREVFDASRTCIESAIGPDALAAAWLRGPAPAAKAPAKAAEAGE